MTTTTRPKPEPVAERRGRNVALWALQIVAASWLLLAAVGKLTGAEAMVATFDAIGLGDWFRYLVAALEVAGAVALLIPRLVGLGGLALVGLMVGATLTQLVLAPAGVVTPLVLLLLCAVIAWGRWRRTAHLWALLTRR